MFTARLKTIVPDTGLLPGSMLTDLIGTHGNIRAGRQV
jgi:hypothetical protein